MSAYEDGSYSCTPGIALIGKVLAGRCKMCYTRASVGSGAIQEGQDPATMTAPAGYVMEAKISDISNPANGECQVTVQISSSDVQEGFYVTGIVLYAEDPDEGEVPYTYLSIENNPEWIRPSGSMIGKIATFGLIAAVGDVTEVSAEINDDTLVTRSAVLHIIAGAMVRREIAIPITGWTKGAEEAPDAYYVDLTQDDVTEGVTPVVSILPSYIGYARECVMSAAVKSGDGFIRLYSENVPTAEIVAELALFRTSDGEIEDINAKKDEYVLPVATSTTLGGVKIGEGLNVGEDGTVSAEGYTLPVATSDTLGGVKADTATDSDTVPVKIGSGQKLYVPAYPTTLPASDVSAWAKEATKPSYSASEVGALPDTTGIPSKLSDLAEDVNHRVVTDAEKETWNAKTDFSGDYNDLDNKPTIPDVSEEDVAANTKARHTHSNKSVLDGVTASRVAAWDAKSDFSGSYDDLTDKPDIDGKISTHNADTSAHSDIRLLISANTAARHTHDNKDVLDGITEDKVAAWDAATPLITDSDGNTYGLSVEDGILTITQLTDVSES